MPSKKEIERLLAAARADGIDEDNPWLQALRGETEIREGNKTSSKRLPKTSFPPSDVVRKPIADYKRKVAELEDAKRKAALREKTGKYRVSARSIGIMFDSWVEAGALDSERLATMRSAWTPIMEDLPDMEEWDANTVFYGLGNGIGLYDEPHPAGSGRQAYIRRVASDRQYRGVRAACDSDTVFFCLVAFELLSNISTREKGLLHRFIEENTSGIVDSKIESLLTRWVKMRKTERSASRR